MSYSPRLKMLKSRNRCFVFIKYIHLFMVLDCWVRQKRCLKVCRVRVNPMFTTILNFEESKQSTGENEMLNINSVAVNHLFRWLLNAFQTRSLQVLYREKKLERCTKKEKVTFGEDWGGLGLQPTIPMLWNEEKDNKVNEKDSIVPQS